MGFRSWLRGEPQPPTEDFSWWSGVPLVDPSNLTAWGGVLPDQAALSLPTFFRGVQILTDLTGQLTFHAVRGGTYSDSLTWADPEVIDPQPKILVDPSPFSTRGDVLRYSVRSLILRGNSYFWLTGHDAAGFPTMAVPINPDEVQVRWNENQTQKRYTWRDQDMTEGFDLLHIMFPPLFGEPTGQGILEAAAVMLGYALEQQTYAGEFYGESAVPTGVLQHPGRLNSDEALALRAQWETLHAKGRGTAVLSGGISYEPLSISPEQAQFLQSRSFSNQQIATILGIPGWFLNAGSPPGTASSLTYQNLGAVFAELTRLTLAPTYLARIEEGFQRILPRGQSVRFDTEQLLRTDDATRWASQKVALDAGILTLDEVRRLEGREPLPEPVVPPQLVGDSVEEVDEDGLPVTQAVEVEVPSETTS